MGTVSCSYFCFCHSNDLAVVPVHKAEKPVGAPDCDFGSDVTFCAGHGKYCVEYGIHIVERLVPVHYGKPEHGAEYGTDWTGSVGVPRRQYCKKL